MEFLSAIDTDCLLRSFTLYRELEQLLRITLEERSTILPEGEKLELLARCHDGSSGEELKGKTTLTMMQVRGIFLATAKALSRGLKR